MLEDEQVWGQAAPVPEQPASSREGVVGAARHELGRLVVGVQVKGADPAGRTGQ